MCQNVIPANMAKIKMTTTVKIDVSFDFKAMPPISPIETEIQ